MSCSSSGVIVVSLRPWLIFPPFEFLGRGRRSTSRIREKSVRPSVARSERRGPSVRPCVCLSFSREAAATERARVESATTTSTRACANLAPRTTNRGLESGLARHPCWQMLKSGATSEKLPSYHPLSTATLGKEETAPRDIYRVAQSAEGSSGKALWV